MPSGPAVSTEQPPRLDDEEVILVVDDDASIRELIVDVLTAKNHICLSASSAEEALKIMTDNHVDLVITDIYMSGMTGVDLLARISRQDPDLPVILITGMADMDAAIEALKKGAYDFLTKPFHLDTLAFSAARALEKRRFTVERRAYQEFLERTVAERTRDLKRANLDLILALSEAIEAKDRYTRGHCNRVRVMSQALGEAMGLDKRALEMLEYAALLHDIGKIAVPEDILNKRGPLTAEEFGLIKEHPLTAVKMLGELALLGPAVPAIRGHHERLDGRGYPDGLKGDQIPLEARILAVPDAFDAMTSHRPYRPAMPLDAAVDELCASKGTQFDPVLVDLFLEHSIARKVVQ
jgi:putative two-component system response regulator